MSMSCQLLPFVMVKEVGRLETGLLGCLSLGIPGTRTLPESAALPCQYNNTMEGLSDSKGSMAGSSYTVTLTYISHTSLELVEDYSLMEGCHDLGGHGDRDVMRSKDLTA